MYIKKMTSKPLYKIKKCHLINVSIHKLEKNTDCSICRLNLNYELMNTKEDNSITVGNCGHAFHSGCINAWLVQNTPCPLCFETWSVFKEPTTPPPDWSDDQNT
jgi:hypothetical protein